MKMRMIVGRQEPTEVSALTDAALADPDGFYRGDVREVLLAVPAEWRQEVSARAAVYPWMKWRVLAALVMDEARVE